MTESVLLPKTSEPPSNQAPVNPADSIDRFSTENANRTSTTAP